MISSGPDLDSPAEVLADARAHRAAVEQHEVRLLESAVLWAAMNSTDSIADAAALHDRSFGDRAVPVAGEGAPWVAESAVAEFSAAIGRSTDAGKAFVGEALELRHRLPGVWAQVVAGRLSAWRARRIAQHTVCLTRQGAAFVDAHLASVAHSVSWAQLERLVTEAIARFMPEEARRRREAAADGRGVWVDHDQVTFNGTTQVRAELDLADALDLETAVAQRAEEHRSLGSTESLDVRRALALGDIARAQLTLDLADRDADSGDGADDGSASSVGRAAAGRATPPRSRRRIVLYVHLSEEAIRGAGSGPELHLARVDNTRTVVTAEQVRTWCGNPDAQVVTKPVIDLAEHVHAGAYEVPDRIQEAASLRDLTCVFPWCTRPARRCTVHEPGCDNDHVVAHSRGGPTCLCNIAPLCRRHHRLKTHTGWGYTVLEPGSYLWSSPHGYQFLRDHHGTLDVSRDRSRIPPGRDHPGFCPHATHSAGDSTGNDTSPPPDP